MKSMKKKTLIFDLDGTMYRGKQLIEGGLKAVTYCQQHDIPFLFLTNNATRTPEQNVRHMEEMGYQNIRPEQFYNSAMAAAQYAKETFGGSKAWFVGEKGMEEALKQYGFEITDQSPDFVFVGLDRHADYQTYSKALSLMFHGAKLIGTNKDRKIPDGDDFLVGNGAVVHMFEYALDEKCPDIGKPYKEMLDLCLNHYGLCAEDVILIGDNLETDIALGYNNGVQTVFVTTGVHKSSDIERLNIYPDLVVEDLDQLDLNSLCSD